MEEQKKNSEHLLEVRDLVVEYTSDKKVVHAVNGVSFTLDKGKTLGLVGETGAGKTTIARSILRILPEPPAKVAGGEIIFEGRDLLSEEEKALRQVRGKKISMIFQDPMTALNPLHRIGNQIAEVIQLHENLGKEDAKKKAAEMLEMVGIPADRYRDYPHQFSGGMMQRVVIAMALTCNPELLLADEPTTALDVTIQAQVLDMIKELREKYQTAMIMITHDLGIVAEVCDEVAVVYAGEIVEYGTKEEIYDHPSHPYTQGLFKAIPDLNSKVRRLTTIEGLPPDPTNLPEGCAFSPRCPYATEECHKQKVSMAELGGKHTCRCLHVSKEGR